MLGVVKVVVVKIVEAIRVRVVVVNLLEAIRVRVIGAIETIQTTGTRLEERSIVGDRNSKRRQVVIVEIREVGVGKSNSSEDSKSNKSSNKIISSRRIRSSKYFKSSVDIRSSKSNSSKNSKSC
jgi:hypothetical protein